MTWRTAALGAMLALGSAEAGARSLPTVDAPTIYARQPWRAGSDTTARRIGESHGHAELEGRRLEVQHEHGTTMTFLGARTRIADREGQPLSPEVLASSPRVRVDYDVVGNTAIARRVTVLDTPASPACVAAPPTGR